MKEREKYSAKCYDNGSVEAGIQPAVRSDVVVQRHDWLAKCVRHAFPMTPIAAFKH
jgi:hypothetical protein